MKNSRTSIFARDDTFFGVCEALGQDLGFNPFYLRLVLGIGLLWNPVAVVAAYAGAAIVILATRLIAPDPRLVEPIEDDQAFVETGIARSAPAKHGHRAQAPLPAAV